jgi:hypothetical protein
MDENNSEINTRENCGKINISENCDKSNKKKPRPNTGYMVFCKLNAAEWKKKTAEEKEVFNEIGRNEFQKENVC